MSSRSWFFAANGQQQGPYPEAQFRDLIARGTVNSQTLVWAEGMAGWQKAGDIPGLMAGASAPPAMAPAGGVMTDAGSGYGSGGRLWFDCEIWDFTWHSLLLLLGMVFIIPTPWVLRWYIDWFTGCVQVPGRPNLSFTGTAGKIAIYYFGAIAIVILLGVVAAISQSQGVGNLGSIFQVVIYWLFLRYVVANIASNGQPLGLSFSGSIWAYIGWTLLTVISFLTIIGWAWVFAAQVRWVCRNVQGTRHQIVFHGTGLQYLWRVIVAVLASMFIIPIPWVYRWMLQWQLSQTELVDRRAYQSA